MKTTPKPSPFEGCWQTQWSVCQNPKADAGGSRLSIKTDAVDATRLTGAWTGTSDDANGFRHCGFLTGIQTGNVLEGTWYEVLYKNPATCPVLSYAGTFRFTMKGNDAFRGVWTDKDGPNHNCPAITYWNGTRSAS